MNFFGWNVSLDKFLKAFGMIELKNYPTHLEKIFGKLQNCKILGVEFEKFNEQLQRDLFEIDALDENEIVRKTKKQLLKTTCTSNKFVESRKYLILSRP